MAAKSQGQRKAETFLLSQAELAQLSSINAKLVDLQCRMEHLDREETLQRDLDLELRQPAVITARDLQQPVQPAEMIKFFFSTKIHFFSTSL